MILNGFPSDPNRLKIIILSTPKTGNTWLRWLLHEAYRIPLVELPEEWAPGCADDLPPGFVTHQHLFPNESLVRWLVENRAVALTTIRHPADTFLSYFHYVKWHDSGSDPSAEMLKQDGDRPGKNALKFIKQSFPQSYAISLVWAKLGSCVVRYEDLLADPLSQLRKVTSKIAPLNEDKLKTAVVLCRPKYLTRFGIVDPLHLRTSSTGGWIRELPPELVDVMANSEPYVCACKTYGYDWNTPEPEPSRYDYDEIDPFRDRDRFDNGELIGAWLTKIYFEIPEATTRWPEPCVTEGESFWNWLRAPSELANSNPDLPAGTLTNIMTVIHNLRPDLQSVYKDPVGSDRMGFVVWFLGRAKMEFEIAWGLIEPVLKSYCDYLNSLSHDRPFGQSSGKGPAGQSCE